MGSCTGLGDSGARFWLAGGAHVGGSEPFVFMHPALDSLELS